MAQKPLEAPPTQSLSVAKLPSSSPAPTIGGGGVNWNGSKFSGDSLGKGPEGAFNAAVTGRFRKFYSEPSEAFGPAELELTVTGFAGDAKEQQALVSDSIDFGLGSGAGMGFLAKGVPAKAVAASAFFPSKIFSSTSSAVRSSLISVRR